MLCGTRCQSLSPRRLIILHRFFLSPCSDLEVACIQLWSKWTTTKLSWGCLQGPCESCYLLAFSNYFLSFYVVSILKRSHCVCWLSHCLKVVTFMFFRWNIKNFLWLQPTLILAWFKSRGKNHTHNLCLNMTCIRLTKNFFWIFQKITAYCMVNFLGFPAFFKTVWFMHSKLFISKICIMYAKDFLIEICRWFKSFHTLVNP